MINPDPVHDRPPKPSVDDLRHDVESLYGNLLRLERTATTSAAQGAFHAATALVAGLLWPGAAA